MRRWLKRLAGAALGLAAAAAVAGALFMAHPELLLTSRTAAAALQYFAAAYAPRWSSLTFSAAAVGNRRHRYILNARDFCADDPKGVFTGCLARLEITAVVFYSARGPRVEILESLTALGKAVAVDLRRRAPARASNAFAAAFFPAPVRALRVELPDFVLRSAKGAVTGRLSVVLTPDGRRPLAAEADLMTRGASGKRRLKAALTADTDLFKGGAPTFVDAVARADYARSGRARAAFRVRRGARGYEASGGVEILPSTGPIRSVRLAACRGAARPHSGELACRYELIPAGIADGRLGDLKNVAGDVRVSGQVQGEKFTVALAADIDPLKAWYELSGGVEARVAGRLGRPLETMTLSHEARALLKVPRFEDLVAFLRETKYGVPAPIHVLKGPLSLALESRGDPRAGKQTARYVFASDLAGQRQRFVLRAAGDVTVVSPGTADRSFEHAGELILKEVALELPRLEVGQAPKVTVDKRIKPGDAEPVAVSSAALAGGAGPLALRSRVTVRTEKPLILFSNLAKEPVPAVLNLVATYPPAALGGAVAFQKFDVELFRRSATVDHINVTLSSGSTVGALEWLVLYKAPAVTISILILGTTERPRVELTSVPPLKREDIIGLLIFGKSPSELDPEQTASVSNTETALESRAFGLASLYLFGATPIEHVGYDPATKSTSVKLRLPGGANLTLGSDFDRSRQLTVRKPLAPHWALQSEFTSQGQQSRAATTFLEWFNRY